MYHKRNLSAVFKPAADENDLLIIILRHIIIIGDTFNQRKINMFTHSNSLNVILQSRLRSIHSQTVGRHIVAFCPLIARQNFFPSKRDSYDDQKCI